MALKTKGKNNDYIQKSNRSLILRLLTKKPVCSRSELARQTGLTQASITKIISKMIDTGIVSETGLIEGTNGHRSIGITLNADRYCVMGIKIARGSFDIAVFNFRGELIEQHHTPLSLSGGARAAMDGILRAAKQMLCPRNNLLAIGVAVPGPYLSKTGRFAVISESFGWENINIIEEFAQNFDIPVCIEHDANAGALALWRRRADTEQGVLVNFLAGEGVGAGIVVDGRILRGSSGIAGEVGHMSVNVHGPRCVCGNYGCLEGYASSLHFEKQVQSLLPSHPESLLHREPAVTADAIFRCMARGDAFCREQVEAVGTNIGCGIANIVYLYDPDEIVLTDVMRGGGTVLLDAIRTTVQQRVLPIIYSGLTIRLDDGSIDPILEGAAALALERVLDEPERICRTAEEAENVEGEGNSEAL